MSSFCKFENYQVFQKYFYLLTWQKWPPQTRQASHWRHVAPLAYHRHRACQTIDAVETRAPRWGRHKQRWIGRRPKCAMWTNHRRQDAFSGIKPTFFMKIKIVSITGMRKIVVVISRYFRVKWRSRGLISGMKCFSISAGVCSAAIAFNELTALSLTTVSSQVASDSSGVSKQCAWARPPTSSTKSPSFSARASRT